MILLLLLLLLFTAPALAQDGLTIRTIPAGTPIHEVPELGNNTAPTAWDSIAFTNAPAIPLTGFDSGACPGTTVAKLIWQNTTTKWGYLSVNCGDTDDEVPSLSNDDAAWFSTGHDNVDFRWRLDTHRLLDSSFCMVSANLQPVYLDGCWVNGTRDTSISKSVTTSRVITPGASWKIFIKFDLGNVTPNGIGLFNLALRDKDSGVAVTIKHHKGSNANSLLDINEYGFIRFSSGALSLVADVTPPTVGTPALTSVTATSARATSTVSEAATCRVRSGTVTKTYTVTGPNFAAVGGTCVYDFSSLAPSTQYFLVMDATDAAGNSATSAEANFTTSAVACTHFAGATAQGSANGSSDGNRFLISGFWSVAAPGHVLCLASGTYQGSSSMIVPPQNLNGTALNPITIRATATGSSIPIIDGQQVRSPILLIRNDYFIIEDIDAKNGFNESVVRFATGADNNIARRVCAWDVWPASANSQVIGNNGNTGNLFEDVCAFGQARKMVESSQSGDNATWRRIWAMWTGPHSSGSPAMTFTLAYNNRSLTAENLIGTWDNASGGPADPYGIFAQDGINDGKGVCVNSKILGSIAYLKATQLANAWRGELFGSRSVDCFEFRHVVAYIENAGGHSSHQPIQGQLYDGGGVVPTPGNPSSAPVGSRQFNNVSEIGGGASAFGGSTANNWQQTNHSDQNTVGATPNIWNGVGSTGARVCFRYVNGTLTSTPLWPWPMDSRIRQALTRSGRDPDAVFGSVGGTLTTQLEAIFGSIPAGCRS